MDLDDIAAILATAEFFEICDLEQRRLLAFASEVRAYGAGDTLYRAGDVADGAYILVDGALSVAGDPLVPGMNYQTDQPGALLGELGLILKRPRRATVTAKRRCDVLFVPRSAFSKLVSQYPGMAERTAERIGSEMGAYLEALRGVQKKIGKK